MAFTTDQVQELKLLAPGLSRCEEGGYTYFLLPSFPLPTGCRPERTDLLLCPVPRDGYTSRLYYADRVVCHTSLNWNGAVRVLERNWHAFSWRINQHDLRLAQMVVTHLRALQ